MTTIAMNGYPITDATAIQSTLARFVPPGQIGEVRFIGTPGGTVGVYFGHDQIAEATSIVARESMTAKGAYVVMNCIDSALSDRPRLVKTSTLTKDSDIVRRNHFYVDFDPKGEGRGPNDSATNVEKEAARLVMDDAHEWLRSQGFPEATICDSSNGWHLLYRIDEPNDETIRKLLQRFLQSLDKRFSDATVGVDQTVHNAARITKCYGAISRKGEHRHERPHRLSRIVYEPDGEPAIVTRELLQSVIDDGANRLLDYAAGGQIDGVDVGGDEPQQSNGHTPQRDQFVLPERAQEGNRHNTLIRSAGAFRAIGMGEAEIRDCLAVVNRTRCGGEKPDSEIAQIARDYAVKDVSIGMAALMAGDQAIEAAQRQQKLQHGAEALVKRIGEGATPEELQIKLTSLLTTVQSVSRAPLQIRTARTLVQEFPSLRRPIIQDLLRVTETMNVVASSKTGKSWLVLQLALSVAAGVPWCGRFYTYTGNVLIIDNELHPETLANRLPTVAMAMGLTPEQYQDRIHIVSLRGCLQDMFAICRELMTFKPGEFDLVIKDAWYRFQPTGSDENANGDVARLYNEQDRVTRHLLCAIANIHHTTKGDQSGKSATDIGAGAGSQSRAADVHLTMIPHEAPSAVVVQVALRSWKPIDPYCLKWEFPLWRDAPELDVADVKKPAARGRSDKSPRQNNKADADEERQTKEAEDRSELLAAIAVHPNGETKTALRETTKFNSAKFDRLTKSLIELGAIEKLPGTKERNKVVLYKPTEASQASQASQKLPVTALTGAVSQQPPYVVGGFDRLTSQSNTTGQPELTGLDGDYR